MTRRIGPRAGQSSARRPFLLLRQRASLALPLTRGATTFHALQILVEYFPLFFSEHPPILSRMLFQQLLVLPHEGSILAMHASRLHSLAIRLMGFPDRVYLLLLLRGQRDTPEETLA
jgi:hypothetical protein